MFTKINTSMTERLDARRAGDKGFTLVELLVVVIIIGILAAIAIPVFLNQRESAWQQSVGSDLRNGAIALESYATDNNGSLADLGATDGAELDTLTELEYTATDGNTITIAVVGNAYVLTGVNENLTGESQEYDSAAGGLQPWDDGE